MKTILKWAPMLLLALAAARPCAAQADGGSAKVDEVKKLLDDFEKAYKNKEESARISAVEMLTQAKDKKIIDRLAKILGGPDVDAVKLAAARTFSMYSKDKNASAVLLKLLPSFKKSPELQAAVVSALGDIADTAAAPAIADLFKDRNTTVARAAIIASAKIRDKSFVDPLLKLFKEFSADMGNVGVGVGVAGGVEDERSKRKAELKDPVRTALADITRQSFETAKEYDTWWKKNKGTFKGEGEEDPKKSR